MNGEEEARLLQHERYMRIAVTVLGGLLATALVAGIFGVGALNRLLEGQDALARALDVSRDQVESLGAEPVAPPSDEVIENPSVVETVAPPAPIDATALEQAARDVMADVIPGAVASAVDRYVAACVASGECVGPPGTPGTPGPPGEDGSDGDDGSTPGPDDVAAAVLAVCASELDCTATGEEIAAAVTAYCGAETDPCGRWTEAEILALATRATIDYLHVHPFWCPPKDEFEPGEPIGPCWASKG
jgi:hypothetical protein